MTRAASRLLAVLGPTATGKSALGLTLAERLGGEIINCDSTAVYRGFDIGTDKVPVGERRGIPHHLIDIVEPTDEYTAADYGRDAAARHPRHPARGRDARSSSAAPGFYFRALTRGLFPGPGKDAELRGRLDAIADAARRRVSLAHGAARRSGVGRAHPAARSEAADSRAGGVSSRPDGR